MFKQKVIILLLCLLIFFLPMFAFIPTFTAAAENAPVYVISLKMEIGPSWLLYLERALKEAREAGAQALILELDTPGGFVDAALQAREMLAELEVPVYAYVNTRALSAGAYLALAADYLYMSPRATLGAAEPRLAGTGEVTDEKFLSFWEAEMRVAAELRGRDPQLAAAMVRREIEIEDLVEAGKLLTLTARDAERLNFSDGTAASLQDLLFLAGLSGSSVVRTAPTPREQFWGWLIHPIVAAAILSLAFLFLFVEILTAGFGVAGLLSILCFGLFFGGHLFSGVAGWPAIFLFVFGLVLILVEAFVPGFGIFGLSGLVAVGVSIVLSAVTTADGLRILLFSFFFSVVFSWFAFRYFQRKGTLRRFILTDALTQEAGYSSTADLSYLVGREGVTITPLRPSGIMEADDTRYDVVSEGAYLAAGTRVRVVRVEGRRIVVRTLQNAGESAVKDQGPAEDRKLDSPTSVLPLEE